MQNKVDIKMLKIVRAKKLFFSELVLACDNEILNTIEVVAKSLRRAESIAYKNNHPTHTISLVMICLLLLVVISISCYYFSTKHCLEINVYYHFNIKNK